MLFEQFACLSDEIQNQIIDSVMNKSVSIYRFFVALALILPTLTSAEPMEYGLPFTGQDWAVSMIGDACTLSQDIPTYGTAVFRQVKNGKLSLQITSQREGFHSVMASVHSMPPSWKYGVAVKHIGEEPARRGRNTFQFDHDHARRLFSELESGMAPTFYYPSQDNKSQEILMALSPFKFLEAMREFLACTDALTPFDVFSLDYAENNFVTDKSEITPIAEEKLDHFIANIINDIDVSSIVVAGHADHRASNFYNHRLSRERALTVTNFLIARGIPSDLIQTQFYGESKPLLPNKSQYGMFRNRRVEIRVNRQY